MGRLDVTFVGYGPSGDIVSMIPLEDLSESPWVCSGPDNGPCHHWVQDGDPSERRYRYAGPCDDVPGPHTYPGWRAGQDGETG